MNYTGKRVGIWGFGTTGKSLLNFFNKQGSQIQVLDARVLTTQEQQDIASAGGHIRHPQDSVSFLHDNDYIVPSPGIDTRPYQGIAHKYVSELDIFADRFTKPIIAVTGSSGKTSIVTLLNQLLHNDTKRIVAGGNIGIPMLDILDQTVDGIILELSSFQLEQSQRIAPDLAIWTNLHSNHLDRHGTMAEYAAAKSKIITHQRLGQRALLPLYLHTVLPAELTQRTGYAFFAVEKPTTDMLGLLTPYQSCYYLHNNCIMIWHQGQTQLLYTSPLFATITYPENWLIIGAALHLLGIPLETIDAAQSRLHIPDHRLELVTIANGIHFYNDSKSTTTAATLAAVNKLSPAPLILFLGGVSKGIDRRELIAQLVGKVRYILCFGSEACQLASWCTQQGIATSEHKNLDDAFATCLQIARSGDTVLLSPAGASFDLFTNYIDRGMHFKTLVQKLLA